MQRLTLLLPLLLIACSSGHPAVSENDVPVPAPPAPKVEEPEEESRPAGTSSSGSNEGGPCTPHEQRECIKSERVGGRTMCTRTLQICKADGSDWLPCGTISLGSE